VEHFDDDRIAGSGHHRSMSSQTRWRKAIEKISAGVQEIGILLIAFAPLESAVVGKDLAAKDHTFRNFFLVGVLLFLVSLAIEWRMTDDQH
jgi:hypothetical protein